MSPKRTINEKGHNTIMIKILRQEKQRITILLSVSAERDKLAPLVVFIDNPNGRIYKNLNNNLYVKQKYLNNNKRLVYIPKGLTSILQTLDIQINNLFKKAIQEKYTQYIIENNNSSKIERNNLLNWIYEVWYSSKYITKQGIINTFKETGISLDINGSENRLLKSLEEQKNIWIIVYRKKN